MSKLGKICSEERRRKTAASIAAGRTRRLQQIVKCFDLKIDGSHLSKRQIEELHMIFTEAKWLYNSFIKRMDENESFDIWKHNVLHDKKVVHLDKDGNEVEQHLEFISSSQKQCIQKRICSSLKTLHTLKEKGIKVGTLGFVSSVNSVPLKQYGVTHAIKSKDRVRVQGVHGTLRVRGLHQWVSLPIEYDNANWLLIRKADGYHIKATVYFNKDQWYRHERRKYVQIDDDIGIDFGCSTSLTLSDGRKIDAKIGETERLKRLQRKLSRQKKNSSGYRRTCRLIRMEHERTDNRKNELANQFVGDLKPYRRVIIQDEQLAAWQACGHGKSVGHSILGRVKTQIKRLPNARIIAKDVPTSKICLDCGAVNDNLKLSDRTVCCICNNVAEDRDVHAAKNMVKMYEMFRNFVGTERTEIKREDFLALYESRFNRDYGNHGRLNHEAAQSSVAR